MLKVILDVLMMNIPEEEFRSGLAVAKEALKNFKIAYIAILYHCGQKIVFQVSGWE